MKKSAASLCLMALLLCFATPPAFAQEKILVGISTPTADHGWTGGVVWWAEQAVKEFGKKYPDLEFIFLPSDSDKEQAEHVESLLAQKIRALVILPHKPAPLTTVLNKVNKTGAFIVVVDRSIPKVPKDVYLAGDNYGFGRECGLYLAGALEGKVTPCLGKLFRLMGSGQLHQGKELVPWKFFRPQSVNFRCPFCLDSFQRFLFPLAVPVATHCADSLPLQSRNAWPQVCGRHTVNALGFQRPVVDSRLMSGQT